MTARWRWFGATGRRVPEIVLEGTLDTTGALVLDAPPVDESELRAAHARGIPVAVRAESAEDVLWRRSKLGLVLASAEKEAVARYMIASLGT